MPIFMWHCFMKLSQLIEHFKIMNLSGHSLFHIHWISYLFQSDLITGLISSDNDLYYH